MNNIKYSINRNQKAKRMRLDIYSDGSVVITTPPRKQRKSILKFLERNIGKFSLINKVDRKAIHTRSKKKYLEYKDEALWIATKRVTHFNEIYKLPLGKISVRNQKARWGSCSEAGNLIFNYKIVFLPEAQRDYIIVHELCHLGELNHSPKFWKLVEKTIPDYKSIRKSLAHL